MPMLIYSCCFSSSMNWVTEEKLTLSSSTSHFYQENVTQLCLQWWKFALTKPYEFPSPGPLSALDDHLFSVPTSTTSIWVSALIVTKQILRSASHSQLSKVRGTRSCKWTGVTLVISSTTYRIPNSTQHDAQQRCPALIVLKEENNNNNTGQFA